MNTKITIRIFFSASRLPLLKKICLGLKLKTVGCQIGSLYWTGTSYQSWHHPFFSKDPTYNVCEWYQKYCRFV